MPDKQLVDSTGIYFTPMLRHLDRGSQEVDNGHYLNFEYVFGATAAAALVPAADDRGHFDLATSFSIPIFSCTAKTPTWPGARS